MKTCYKCGQNKALVEFIYYTKRHEMIIDHAKCYDCYKKREEEAYENFHSGEELIWPE